MRNYNILKKSGALEAEVTAAAEAIGFPFYTLPKITRMHFLFA